MRLRKPAAIAAGTAVTLVVAFGLAACGVWTTSVTEAEFTKELAIPPLAESTVEDGVRTFDLTAQKGSTEFPSQDGPTETWGFNGEFLGPPCGPNAGRRSPST